MSACLELTACSELFNPAVHKIVRTHVQNDVFYVREMGVHTKNTYCHMREPNESTLQTVEEMP